MTERTDQKGKEEVERSSPPGEIVYKAILHEGEHELQRGNFGLAWSGLAAGLSMGFSLLAQAFLWVHLPAAKWQPLLINLGYTVGFLVVILGRQQLFTESTLTAILPVIRRPEPLVIANVVRLWTIVLLTNLIGGFVFAWLTAHSTLVDAEVREACSQLGQGAMRNGFGTTLLRGILAGWLIAMMVWLLPFAQSGRISVIIIISYLVGLGHFPHIVAGSVEVFYLVATSQISPLRSLSNFVIPTLIGNTIGGVSLVAALSHAQFMVEDTQKKTVT